MEIENIGELLYAYHENRLSLAKGFGKKTLQNVIEAIMYYQEQQGNYLYAQVVQLASDIESLLHKLFNIENIKITGSFAGQSETIDELKFVVALPEKNIIDKISSISEFKFIEKASEFILYKYNRRIKIKFFPADEKAFFQKSFETIGTAEFMDTFNQHLKNQNLKSKDQNQDTEIF